MHLTDESHFRVLSDILVLLAGVHHPATSLIQSNGAVVLWRMVTRNLFGGANKNDRVEETLVTSSPHRGAVTCLIHTRPGTYSALAGPLVFSGSNDHTIKVGIVHTKPACRSQYTVSPVRLVAG